MDAVGDVCEHKRETHPEGRVPLVAVHIELSYGSTNFDLAVSQIVGNIIPKKTGSRSAPHIFRVAIRDCAGREVDKESHTTHRRGVW